MKKDKLDVLEAFCKNFRLQLIKELEGEKVTFLRAGFTGSFFTANEILEKIRLIKEMTDEEVSKIGEGHRTSLSAEDEEILPEHTDPEA